MTTSGAAAPHPPPDELPSDAARDPRDDRAATRGDTAFDVGPPCPLCATPMVLRLSRRGPTAGSRYWGCPRDPECLGRRELAAGEEPPGPDRPASIRVSASARGGPGPRSAAASAVARPEDRLLVRGTRPEPDLATLPKVGDDRARLHLRLDLLAVSALLAIGGVVVAVAGPGALPGGIGASSTTLAIALVVLGALVAAASLVVPPRHRRYAPRGDAERATSRALAPLLDEGWVVLEDRRMPASSELVRHLVVGPGGVFTLSSHAVPGRLGIRGHDLYVNGRRRTGIVEQARRQAAAAVNALRAAGHADNASALICVHRAQLPVFGSALDGVSIVDGPGLLRRLRSEPPKLNGDRIGVLSDALDRAMPPVGRPG